MMRLVSIVLLCTAFAWAGCSETAGDSEHTSNKATRQPISSSLDSMGTRNLMSTLASYYELKDALVATSAPKADAAAAKLAASAEDLKSSLQKDGDGQQLIPHLDTIITKTADIRGMMDESCEHKRIHFEPISNALYTMLQKVSLKNAGVYHQYCPMAFNGKGAYWLSNEEEIKNPYFGDKMLECGEVTDTLN